MSGAFDILKEQIVMLIREIETYKINFNQQIERADGWMELYMKIKEENEELKELLKSKEN